MKPRQLHFALREWRDHMRAPVRIAALLGAGVVLTLVGPFETADIMRPLPRLAYWTSLVVACYSVGYAANAVAQGSLIVRIAVAGTLTGLGNAAVVMALNGAALGHWPPLSEALNIAAIVFVISVIIAAIFQIAYAQPPQSDPATGQRDRTPPILDRLPVDKRGALVALSVEDHYVRVQTTAGTEMVLLRLSDAMREVQGLSGLQVHRSHWVAIDQVTAARREGNRAVLTMSLGQEIPVSRRYIPQIKAAGLLPR